VTIDWFTSFYAITARNRAKNDQVAEIWVESVDNCPKRGILVMEELFVPNKRIRTNGHTFFFKFEEDHPELLHIYARHRKEPDDAIDIFFQGISIWNEEYKRFESTLANERLYWFWLDEPKKIVMVITCFDI
jgi:hypothetical protein